MPLQSIIVPRVVMKEGIFPFTVIKPFNRPRRTPTQRTINGMMNKFTPICTRNTNVYAVYDIIDPIDRSNSPQIISIPTANVTIPKSGDSLARIAKFLDERKRCSGEKIEKNKMKAINTKRIVETL